MTVPTAGTAGTGSMVIMMAGHSAIISEMPDMRRQIRVMRTDMRSIKMVPGA